jgi:hypothetical protein
MAMTRFSILFQCFRPPLGGWTVALVASLLGSGCGKSATVEDCERIVVRMAELELAAHSVSDPVLVQQQVDATKESFRKRALEECVGRQIPPSAMECIGRATSTDQILGECLD